MTAFNRDRALELLSQNFQETPQGVIGGNLPTPEELERDRLAAKSEAQRLAREVLTGGDRPDELVEDPEFRFLEQDFQQQAQVQPTATHPFPTEHPFVKNEDGTVSNLKTMTVAIDGKHFVIPTMVNGKQLGDEEAIRVAQNQGLQNYPSFDDPQSALEESRKLSQSQAPQAPQQMITRQALRERLGVETPVSRPVLDPTDPQYLKKINKHYEQPYKRAGSMADPKMREALGFAKTKTLPEPELDRSYLDIVGEALTQGFYSAGQEVGGDIEFIGSTLQAIGAKSLGQAVLDYGMSTVEASKLAVRATNIDPITGIDYGPLPDNPVVDALRAAPRFSVDIALAVASGGTSLVRSALGKASKLTGKQLAKRQARVFAGISGAQMFGNQFAESYDYYVNQEGYDPGDSYGLILLESLAAGSTTALTSRIEGSFLFTTKAARSLAAASLPGKLAQNFMIGGLAEGTQEVVEGVLTDAALASIASLRGDEQRLEQVGFLREGYLYQQYRNFAAGALLGAPVGTVTRGFAPPVDPERQRAAEVAVYLERKRRAEEERIASEGARQIAIVEERSAEFAELSDEDLLHAFQSGHGAREFVFIGNEADGTRIRVTPLMAVTELKRRGVEAGKLDTQTVQRLVKGREASKREAGDRRKRLRRALTPLLANVATPGKSEAEVAFDFLSEFPEVAEEIANLPVDADGNVSRKAMDDVLQKYGLSRGMSTRRNRTALRNNLRQVRDTIGRAREEQAQPARPAARREISIRAGERQLIDDAISEYNEENNTDILLDANLSVEQAADLLPAALPRDARVQRVSELRRRSAGGEPNIAPFEGRSPEEVREFREELNRRKEEVEAEEDRVRREERGEDVARDEESERIQREAEQEVQEAEEPSLLRPDQEEAARETVIKMTEMYGKEETQQMLGALLAGENVDPQIREQVQAIADAPIGERGVIATKPQIEPTREAVQTAVEAWSDMFDRSRRGESEVVTPVGWTAAEETEVFPDQSYERTVESVIALEKSLKAALERQGLETDRVTVFIDDGSTTLTAAQKAISDQAKEFGITVVFYRGVPAGVRGFHNSNSPGVVAINASLDSGQMLAEVFLHEAVHDLKARNPEAWNRLLRGVMQVAPELVRKKLLEYDSAYRRAFQKNKRAKVSTSVLMNEIPSLAAELVVDILGSDQTGMAADVMATATQSEVTGLAGVLMKIMGRLGIKNRRTGKKFTAAQQGMPDKLQARADENGLTQAQRQKLTALVSDALGSLQAERGRVGATVAAERTAESQESRPDEVESLVQEEQHAPMTEAEFLRFLNKLPAEETTDITTQEGSFSVKVEVRIEDQSLDGEPGLYATIRDKSNDREVGFVASRLVLSDDKEPVPLYTKIQLSEIVDPDFLKKGIGLQAYMMLIDKSLRSGIPVRSDEMVYIAAVKVYRRMAARGYGVKVNPNAVMDVIDTDMGRMEMGRFVVKKPDARLGHNIFEVFSQPANNPLRATMQGEALAEALADFEAFGSFSLSVENPDTDLGTTTRKSLVDAVKVLRKKKIDLPKVFGNNASEYTPDQFKKVKKQLATVFADLVDNGTGNPDEYAVLTKDVFGLTDAQTKTLVKDIQKTINSYYTSEFRAVAGGLHPKLVQESRSDRFIVGGTPMVADPGEAKTAADTIANRRSAIANIDLLLQRHPEPFANTRNATAFLTDLFRADTIPIPPRGLIANLSDESRHVRFLGQLTDKQREGRQHGLELGNTINRAYSSGEITPAGTGQLMVWGMLSRMLSPFPHESAALQFFTNPDFAELLEMTARGEAQNYTPAQWSSFATRIKATLPGTAKSATSNINAVFDTLLPKLSQVRPDGRTYLQAAHDAFADTTMNGKQLRRFMMSEMPVGMGIDIKVISFLMLLTGRQDVLVMDRVQITNMFDDGRLAPLNVYDGEKGVGAGLSAKYSGLPALALYEAMESQIEPLVRDLYTKAGLNADEATLGAYHWDTWNIASGQAATHGSLSYLVAQVTGQLDQSAPEAMGASETRYGATGYGLTFVPTDLWTDPSDIGEHRLLYEIDDDVFEFTPQSWREIALQRSSLIKTSKDMPRTDAEGRKFSNGDVINEEFILDDGQSPLQDAEGNRIPWYDDPKILKPGAKQQWRALVEANGLRASVRAIDQAQSPIDAGTYDVVLAENEGGSFSVREDLPRFPDEADAEQVSIIQRLNELRRRALGDAPPAEEFEDDIYLDDGPNKGPGLARILSPFLTPMHYTVAATKSGHPVREAVRNIIGLAMRQEVISQRQAVADTGAYNAMPEEWKAKKGYAFAQLMDQYVPLTDEDTKLDGDTEVSYFQSPEDTVPIRVKVSALPQTVQDALLHFRQRSEEQRKDVVAEKRDFVRSVLVRTRANELRKEALKEQEGRPALYDEIEVDIVDGKQVFVTADRYLTKEELVEELVVHSVPSDWGRQYAHFHHAFFGKYKLKAFREDGTYVIVGDAETQGQAYEKLKNFKDANQTEFVRYEAKPAANFDSAEITRLTGRQRAQLKKQLKVASDLESAEITAALRGVVGLKQNRKPFYAPMMQRGEVPAQGFSMDFPRVWQMQNNNFNRWKFGGKMIRSTQPIIERLKGVEPYWSNYLEEHLDRTLFIRPTTVETALDAVLHGLPFVGKLIGDMPTRRTLAAARTFNFLRQLKTPRQWVVNSIQPLQTVYPAVGGQTFREAVALYNSADGKDLLKRIGSISATTGMYIDGTETSLGESAITTVTRGQEMLDKFILRGKISTQSEVRNMNFSAVAYYLHGKKQGMSDVEAAEYARIQGYVGSQFAYTRSNLPPILNGPITSSMLQYRRFQFNMIGFGIDLLKSGNYSGAGKWLLVNTVAGGVKGVLFTLLPGYFLLHKACEIVGLCDETTQQDNIIYETRRYLINTVGEEAANALIFGLPAVAGVDISGSLSLFQEPYGRTFAEKVKSQIAGPTYGLVEDFYDAMTADTVQPVSGVTRAYRALKDTGPAFKWVAKMAENLSGGDGAEYDDRGRLRYYDKDKGRGRWLQLAGGFRTVNESVWALEFDRIQILKEVVDKSMSKSAVAYSSGDVAGAIKEVQKHNAAYPMMSYTIEDLDARIKNAREAATLPQAKRRAESDAPKRVRDQLRMEKMR